MKYSLAVITAPTAEPVTLAEVKQQCGIADEVNAHDDLLNGYIVAARRACEVFLNRQLMTATYDYKVDEFPLWDCNLYLPLAPLQSVTSISYVDAAGDTQTLSTSIYRVLSNREPAEIELKYAQSWPTTRIESEAVTVRMVCGYTSAANVPEPIKLAIKMLVSDWFESRSGEMEMQPAVMHLLRSQAVGDDFHAYGY